MAWSSAVGQDSPQRRIQTRYASLASGTGDSEPELLWNSADFRRPVLLDVTVCLMPQRHRSACVFYPRVTARSNHLDRTSTHISAVPGLARAIRGFGRRLESGHGLGIISTTRQPDRLVLFYQHLCDPQPEVVVDDRRERSAWHAVASESLDRVSLGHQHPEHNPARFAQMVEGNRSITERSCSTFSSSA